MVGLGRTKAQSTVGLFYRHLLHSSNFAGRVALAQVWSLLSAILLNKWNHSKTPEHSRTEALSQQTENWQNTSCRSNKPISTDSYSLLCQLSTLDAVQNVSEAGPLLATILLRSVFVALGRQSFQLCAQTIKPITFKVLQCAQWQ